jgi:hypothetical protein
MDEVRKVRRQAYVNSVLLVSCGLWLCVWAPPTLPFNLTHVEKVVWEQRVARGRLVVSHPRVGPGLGVFGVAFIEPVGIRTARGLEGLQV